MGAEAGGGEVLDIRTSDVKAAAPVFQKQAEALDAGLKALMGRLEGLGTPWGHDEQGRKFGKGYAPAAKKVESAAGMLVLGLTSVHEAMTDLAAGFGTSDAAVAAVFTKDGGAQK